jgi:DNA-binding GntR family transcriptional regulator
LAPLPLSLEQSADSDDIIQGRFVANELLKVSELAERMGTSTNPVREALQQLRG